MGPESEVSVYLPSIIDGPVTDFPPGSPVSTDLPVMVWIYGGGFLAGGSMGANFLDNYLYSGREIAERGNVIVVTLGYRVGTLGFLSTGDSGIPGKIPST